VMEERTMQVQVQMQKTILPCSICATVTEIKVCPGCVGKICKDCSTMHFEVCDALKKKRERDALKRSDTEMWESMRR